MRHVRTLLLCGLVYPVALHSVPHPPNLQTVLENILDPSHVPYTHHKTIGRRDWATPVPLRLTSDLTEEGFTGGWERSVATSPMLRRNLERVGCGSRDCMDG